MRTMLILFTVATLSLSAFAAWLFFGGPENDPTRVKLAAYVARIEATKPRAEAGDVQVEYELARLYHLGPHDAKDLPAAFRWYSKAAEKGHVGARYALGTMHAKGEAVSQDYFRAAEWYRLAANLGNSADAQVALGELYFQGRGVPHDVAVARDWYRKAAERGHPVAQYRLAAMMQEGYAGPLDPVEAFKWLTLAAGQREKLKAHDPGLDPEAALDRLVRTMTQDQLARGEAAARNYRSKK